MQTLSKTVHPDQLAQLSRLRDKLPAIAPGTVHITSFVKLHVPTKLEKKFYQAISKVPGAGGFYSRDVLQQALITANNDNG